MDLRELFSVVWKHRYLVLLVVVLCAVLGAAFAFTKQERYESTGTIAITPDIASQGFVSTENLSTVMGTYAETAESGVVRTKAEKILKRPLDADINTSTEEGTGILLISARADSPTVAHDAADAVTKAFVRRIASDQFVRAEIVDPADTPDNAVQPRPPLIIATSIVVGLGVAVLLALAIDRLRRRIETPDDLAELTTLPLIAQLPFNRSLARRRAPTLVWDDRGLIDVQEGFRSLRTNLTFVADQTTPVIQITSAGTAEGKSTIVANLGMAFAQVGVRTAIVDADLRRPAQHQIFDVDSRPWPEDPSRDPETTWPTRFENLSVLPGGPPLEDPAAVLHIGFARLLESLRESFELVLVDSPPVLPVGDAKITAARVDGVVLVTAAGQDRPAAFQRSIDELNLAGAKLKGIVLNLAPAPDVGYEYYRRPAVVSEEAGEQGAARVPPVAPAPDKS